MPISLWSLFGHALLFFRLHPSLQTREPDNRHHRSQDKFTFLPYSPTYLQHMSLTCNPTNLNLFLLTEEKLIPCQELNPGGVRGWDLVDENEGVPGSRLRGGHVVQGNLLSNKGLVSARQIKAL